MPQDMKVWRKNARAKLIVRLGGRCVDCGTLENLEFDHKIPLTDEQQDYRVRIGPNMRMCMYRREAAEGLLALRCERCNVRKARAGAKQGTFEFDTAVVVYNNEPF